jgi:hypothetical protein
MSSFSTIVTVLASLVFLVVITRQVMKQIASRKDRETFDLSRSKSEHEFDLSRHHADANATQEPSSELDFDLTRQHPDKKEGFDFDSKRRARRKSIPGPWNRRR